MTINNEVMFRATKIRDAKVSNKPVGHFHLYQFDEIKKNELIKKVIIEILQKIIK